MKFKNKFQKRKVYFIFSDDAYASVSFRADSDEIIYANWERYCYLGFNINVDIIYRYDTNNDGRFLDCLNDGLKKKVLKMVTKEAELALALNNK